jgi:hypothetical protein
MDEGALRRCRTNHILGSQLSGKCGIVRAVPPILKYRLDIGKKPVSLSYRKQVYDTIPSSAFKKCPILVSFAYCPNPRSHQSKSRIFLQ